MNENKRQTLTLHGHSITFLQEGAGPVVLLIHGIAGSLGHWRSVVDPLARNATVIAVDLPGHGASSPAGGDYSLGSLAAGLRDLLTALGHDRATLVGHSLGGGIAMQFSYQFPEMTERLVLVSSGGLGLEVNPALRAASLPGAGLFLSVTAEATRRAAGIAGRVLRATMRLQSPASTSSCAATPRWPTRTVAPRFSPRCAAWSVSTAKRFAPGIVSISRRTFPSCSSGGQRIQSSRSRTPGPRTSCCPTAPSQYSTASVISPRRGAAAVRHDA